MYPKYLICDSPTNIIDRSSNKRDAEILGERLHEESKKTKSYGIYQLVDEVGAKRYHFQIFNNDGLKILDSSDNKSFEGYETDIGAKYVAQNAAKDINLEPGFTIKII